MEIGNLSLLLSLSLSCTISPWALRVSLPSHKSQAILPSLSLSLDNFPLSLSATSGLFLSTYIFLFILSNSLLLLNLNPQRLWVFLVGFIWFFVGLFGFNLIICGFCLICLCILFHGIFNYLFWVFFFLILICGFEMQIMCLMKYFYELSMSCEVISKGIYIVLVNLASN